MAHVAFRQQRSQSFYVMISRRALKARRARDLSNVACLGLSCWKFGELIIHWRARDLSNMACLGLSWGLLLEALGAHRSLARA